MSNYKSLIFYLPLTLLIVSSFFLAVNVTTYLEFTAAINELDNDGEKEKIDSMMLGIAEKLARYSYNEEFISIIPIKDDDPLKKYLEYLDKHNLPHHNFKNNVTTLDVNQFVDLRTMADEYDLQIHDANKVLKEIKEIDDHIVYAWIITPECLLIKSYPENHFENLPVFDFTEKRHWCDTLDSWNDKPYYLTPIYSSIGFPDKLVRTILVPIIHNDERIGYIGIALDWRMFYAEERIPNFNLETPYIVIFDQTSNNNQQTLDSRTKDKLPIIIKNHNKTDFKNWIPIDISEKYTGEIKDREIIVDAVIKYEDNSNWHWIVFDVLFIMGEIVALVYLHYRKHV